MKAKDWFLNELDEVKNDVEFQTYDANLRFTEELINISQNENIEYLNKFLSKKLNCSAAYISKVLKGNPNLTIKKMVELGLAFNHKIEIKLVPITSYKTSASQTVGTNSVTISTNSMTENGTIELPKQETELSSRLVINEDGKLVSETSSNKNNKLSKIEFA